MIEIASGSIIAGKYRLEAPLAKGGMGSVWKARHIALDTSLAVKFMSPEVSRLREARARFEREAKAAAMLHSPHVVQIHDYGVEDEVPYLVMELLDGEDLSTRLKRVGRLSTAETGNIVTQVGRALRSAALAGIVHRDLKPGNVFLARTDDEEEVVKVLDFGIAKMPRPRTDDDKTRTGTILGSPRYMSPEQARGLRVVDPRSDLWSLAVIAYRALTGRLPFESPELGDLLVKICTEEAPPPSMVMPALGPAMDAFFARALAHDPDDRYQTAREMALAFATACGEPPSSGAYRDMPRAKSEEPTRHPGELLHDEPAPPARSLSRSIGTAAEAPRSLRAASASFAPESRRSAPIAADMTEGTAQDSNPKTLLSQVARRADAEATKNGTDSRPKTLLSQVSPVLPNGDPTVASGPPDATTTPDRTLTPSMGIDIPAVNLSMRPPMSRRPMVAAIGLVGFLASALMLRGFSHDAAPVSAGTPPPPVVVESVAPAPPPAPAPAPEPTAAPSAMATAAATSAAAARSATPASTAAPASAATAPPRRTPGAAPVGPSKKKHAILGI